MWLYYLVKPIWWLLSLLIFPIKFFNKKKLPKGKLIVASNHLSGWDPVIITTYLNRPIRFMAKSSLYKSKLLKGVFNMFEFVPVNRDGTDYKAIKTALKLLEEDKPFGLFPEGTRNYDDPDHIKDFKNGAALFAVQSKAPIYPVIFKRQSKPFRKNYIMMGEPITLDKFYDQKITSVLIAEATNELHDRMKKIQDDFNETLAEKYPKKFGKTDK